MSGEPQQVGGDTTGSETSGLSVDARLLLSLVFNLLITLTQFVGGLLANSLGLLSDAAHNLSDVVALGLSLTAVRLGRRSATRRRTYAYKRAEVLVALFNSAALIGIAVYIVVEAVGRILNPADVNGLWVMVFAAGGLLVNSGAALLLRSHGNDLNLRAAFLHLVSDALASLGVVVSGLIVYLWGWSYADTIISILVSLWIAREALVIVKRTVNVLMEGTPESIEYEEVEHAILALDRVKGLHDLHIWALSSSDLALSAHVQVADANLSETSKVLGTIKDLLAREFGIGHATLELETPEGACSGSTCEVPPERLTKRRGSGDPHAGHQH